MKINIQRTVRLNALLYYMAIILYCAQYYIGASLLDYKLPKTLSLLLQLMVLGCLFLKWLLTESYNKQKLIWMLVILTSAALVFYTARYRSMILLVCLAFSATDVDFKQIIRLLESNVWFWMLAIILLCKVGFLEDYTFNHTIGVGGVAHSLGFKYYSWLGYTSMALTMMWVYLHKNVNWWKSILLVVVNYLFYKIHTTNLSLLLTAGFVFACWCTESLGIIRLKHKFWGVVTAITPVGLFAGTWTLIGLYEDQKLNITIHFLKSIVNRMQFSAQAFERYGLHLLGTRVNQVGNTDIVYKNISATDAIYIDSGFVYATLAYGLIFTAVLLALYTWIGLYLYRTNQRILLIWLLTMMVGCCINNFICDIINNPLLLVLPCMMLSEAKEPDPGPDAETLPWMRFKKWVLAGKKK